MLWTGFKIKFFPVYLVVLILITGILTADSAGNLKNPAWLEQALHEAQEDGYELITVSALKAFYESEKDFTIIDVRPDYEYQEGHLAHAKNIEFDLGDRLALSQEKKEDLIELLGPDKQHTIVFYCRSFA